MVVMVVTVRMRMRRVGLRLGAGCHCCGRGNVSYAMDGVGPVDRTCGALAVLGAFNS